MYDIISSHCSTLILHYIVILYCYIILLHYIVPLYCYIMLFYYIVTLYCYIISLHYIVTLYRYIILLHYIVTLCYFTRVWEGANVDNHFDQFNLQTVYRVTYKSKEKYEGSFVDEYFHGVGSFAYLHGSKYEGTWHQGSTY